MKTIKWILNVAAWIIVIFFQIVYGFSVGVFAFTEGYGNIIFMWVGMTLTVFLIGAVNITLRKAIKPKRYFARLGLTSLGVALISYIYYQYDFHYGWDYFFESWVPLFAPLAGLIGFHLVDWFGRESVFEKRIRPILYGVAIVLIIAGFYIYWDWLTPFSLPVHNAKLGESLNVELVMQSGGGLPRNDSGGMRNRAVIRGDLLYLGIGPRLAIFDIAYRNKIVLVGESDILADEIGEIVVSGNYAYIAPGIYGDDRERPQKLNIVDISDPTMPKIVAAYSPKGKVVSSIFAFEGTFLISAKNENSNFGDPANEIYLLDMSNPEAPREISNYIFREHVFDSVVHKGYVYVALNTGGHAKYGLQVLDMSEPETPKVIQSLFLNGAGSKLILNGDFLYYYGSTENMDFGFHVLDLSNLQEPREISSYEGMFMTNEIFESIVYLGGGFLDISNPLKFVKRDMKAIQGDILTINENTAVVAKDETLVLYDVSNLAEPIKEGEYSGLQVDEDAEIHVLGAKGIALTFQDFYTLDLSNPLSPVFIKQVYPEDFRRVLGAQKNFVYFDGFATDSMRAMDLSEIESPIVEWQTKDWSVHPDASKFIFNERYAFFFDDGNGIYVYDFADPAEPIFLNHQPGLVGFDGRGDHAFYGNYLYILSGREIHILDISDIGNLDKVGEYNFPPEGSGFARIIIINNLAFVDNSPFSGSEPARMVILDLSNPAQPEYITTYYWGERNAIAGNSLQNVFITDFSGLHVLDFSNPRKPKEIGYYGLDIWTCFYNCMALGPDNIVYIFGYPAGFYVLQFIPPSP